MNKENVQKVVALLAMMFLTYYCFEYDSGWAGIGAFIAFLVAID